MKTPLVQSTNIPDVNLTQVYSSQQDYVNFLAKSFETQALKKYPDYKKNISEFQHLIPNYESLNTYQKEVLTLDTYLHWQLELEELKLREAYNFNGEKVKRARDRYAFFQKLMAEDHHHDTTIMHHLREKLQTILKNELEYEEFKHSYGENVHNQLLKEIVEKRSKGFYYDIVKNQVELNKEINDLNAPGNKHKFTSSVTPHDHINPQHFEHDHEKVNEEKWKYLAYFDIIIDQHLRQVRPSSISDNDEMFKYVKDEYKPLKFVESHLKNNMYYDYMYTLDNEFYVKFKEEMGKVYHNINTAKEEENKVKKNYIFYIKNFLLIIFC
jgi:hypothetical protein